MRVRAMAAAGVMLVSTSCFCAKPAVEALEVQQVCGVTIRAGSTITLKPAKHGHTLQVISEEDFKFNFFNVPDGLYYLSAVWPMEKSRFMTPSHNKFPILVNGSKTDVECARPLVVGLSSGDDSALSVSFQK